jgi:SAM-dependent methyltransferase
MKNGFTQQIKNNDLFSGRDSRNKFVAEFFKDYIGNKVVNIGGGGKKHLKQYLKKDTEYYEIDIDGNPDFKLNLENDLPLKFKDNEFDTVVCTEVLEHLDNFHEVFEELLRIGKTVIISLPNPINDAINYYTNTLYKGNKEDVAYRNEYGKHMKYYGLPFKKPMDRHKWFFSITESEDFFKHYEKQGKYQIEELFATRYYGRGLKGKILRSLVENALGINARKNIFCNNIWLVLKK